MRVSDVIARLTDLSKRYGDPPVGSLDGQYMLAQALGTLGQSACRFCGGPRKHGQPCRRCEYYRRKGRELQDAPAAAPLA